MFNLHSENVKEYEKKKDFKEELKIRGFNLIGDNAGKDVIDFEEGYLAFMTQYKKEDSKETLNDFFEKLEEKKVKIEKRLICRIKDLQRSIFQNTSMKLDNRLCIVGINLPDDDFKSISPFTDEELKSP